MPVAFQQLFAETEKLRGGDAVIFEDDPLFHIFKEPVDGGSHVSAAPQIAFLKTGPDVTIPGDGIEDSFSCFGTKFFLSRAIRTGAVRRKKKASRTDLPECLCDLDCVPGAVENDN